MALKFSAGASCQGVLVTCLLCLAGCGGCQPWPADRLSSEEIRKRAAEQREALLIGELLSLPIDNDAKILRAKPGHWIETRQQFKSNREDLQVLAVGSVAYGSELTKIPGTEMTNETTRRSVLPKGQTKTLDLQFFVPVTGRNNDPLEFTTAGSSKLNFRTQLLNWPLMTPILQAPESQPADELKPHEFQMAVLSPHVLGYEYLSSLDAVMWRGDELMSEERIRSYYVALVKPSDNQYAFPHSLLTMTAMAAVVWDDVDVAHLSSDQQQALIDWVHWGGQLIISGPSSWSRLQNSFLSPYLPADSAQSRPLLTADFESLSQSWITQDRFAPGEREPLEIIGPEVAGLQLELNDRGSWLPGSGQLVAEAAVGRGRIVVTGFPLREPRIFRWKYFSSFLSTGLLRRPPRTLVRSSQGTALEQVWAGPLQGRERDPQLHSKLRILSRDLPLARGGLVSAAGREAAAGMSPAPAPESDGGGDAYADGGGESSPTLRSRSAAAEFNLPPATSQAGTADGGEAARWGGNGGAWNDYSGLSLQALAALKSAAGIELPTRKTILLLLAGYLTCLVPLNWLVFRVVGRLEYAWLAAPLLAIAGVAVVTRIARLDIGFARRTTEISLLELQAGHPRGHLTQYLALYTSLSTNYTVEFPENGSVALPLGDMSRSRLRAGMAGRNLRTNYGRSQGVTLEPLTVYSNSTEMLHAEQMVDLPGGLRLGQTGSGQPAVKNETGLDLRSAMLLRYAGQQQIEYCYLDELTAGAAAGVQWQTAHPDRMWEHWSQSPETQVAQPEGDADSGDTLAVGSLLREVARSTPLADGQTRLIAYTDSRPGDLRVTPAEDQFAGRCVVVAHLTSPTLPPVTPDVMILSRDMVDTLEPLSPKPNESSPR